MITSGATSAIVCAILPARPGFSLVTVMAMIWVELTLPTVMLSASWL